MNSHHFNRPKEANKRATLRAMLVFALLVGSGRPGWTRSDDIWQNAARDAGVPVAVLHAIAIVESGRTWSDGVRRPWPWTLNSVKGPMYFASREQAAQVLLGLIEAGVTNVDIGLMQVNYGYHGRKVRAAVDLLDPSTNLRIASQVLSASKNTVGGDVAQAVGAYHAGFKQSAQSRSTWYQNTVAAYARRLRPQRVAS